MKLLKKTLREYTRVGGVVILVSLLIIGSFSTLAESIEDNLIEFWNFEANSTGSVLGITGTDTGSPTYSVGNGKINNGVGLTTSQSIVLADNAGYDSANNLSFSLWFKTSANPTNQAGIQRGYGGGAGTVVWDMYMPGSTGKWIVTFFDSAGANMVGLTSSTAINDGVYRHIVVTFSRSGATNTGKLYINGVLEDTKTLGEGALAGSITAGISVGVRSGVTNFAGSMDSFGYWTRTLTQADVDYLYNAGTGLQYPLPPLQPSPLQQLPLLLLPVPH